jgi:hypothetical protein
MYIIEIMENTKEFRFVFANFDKLNRYSPDSSRVSDFNDCYLDRNKRIRHFTKDKNDSGKYLLISTEPGMIVKQKKEITSGEAEKLMEGAMLIVKKKGMGRFFVNNIEGYCERVIAFKPNADEPFVDEIQVEFETNQKSIPMLKKLMNPLKVIRVGLFDYLSNK